MFFFNAGDPAATLHPGTDDPPRDFNWLNDFIGFVKLPGNPIRFTF